MICPGQGDISGIEDQCSAASKRVPQNNFFLLFLPLSLTVDGAQATTLTHEISRGHVWWSYQAENTSFLKICGVKLPYFPGLLISPKLF